MKPVKQWAIKNRRGNLARWLPVGNKRSEVIIKHRRDDLLNYMDEDEVAIMVEIREVGK